MKKGTRFGSMLAALLAAGISVCGTADVFGRNFGPKGLLLHSKPLLIWEIWSTGADRIVGASARIDDRPVRAHYEALRKRVEIEPAAALPVGKHTVEVQVIFSDQTVVKKEWDFEIGPDAVPEFPAATSEQLRALAWVNQIREPMGLPKMRLDAQLNATSTYHSRYLSQNKTTGHFETAGKPGFTGTNPGDRVAAVGYVGSSWEVVEFGSSQPEEALRNLLDAPYHRLPFLQPGALAFGSSYFDNRMTATFEMSSTDALVVYPYDGQNDVPLKWDKNERPNPLRLHADAQRPVGYPVMLVRFSPERLKLTVRSARLTTGQGSEVPCHVNTPANDRELNFAVILIPKQPLTPNTTYVAQISASLPGGVDASKTWSFTTRTR